jgi:hypothetical protein
MCVCVCNICVLRDTWRRFFETTLTRLGLLSNILTIFDYDLTILDSDSTESLYCFDSDSTISDSASTIFDWLFSTLIQLLSTLTRIFQLYLEYNRLWLKYFNFDSSIIGSDWITVDSWALEARETGASHLEKHVGYLKPLTFSQWRKGKKKGRNRRACEIMKWKKEKRAKGTKGAKRKRWDGRWEGMTSRLRAPHVYDKRLAAESGVSFNAKSK